MGSAIPMLCMKGAALPLMPTKMDLPATPEQVYFNSVHMLHWCNINTRYESVTLSHYTLAYFNNQTNF